MSRRKKLTLVHKTNVLIYAGSLWSRVVREVQADYPGVEVDYLHIDAATIFMVTDPSRFDVIVTDNLFGDIITDLAGAVGGGIGMAASANLNPSGSFPSMFEPVHGSAPDIAGTGKADPTAAIMSTVLLLEHLKFFAVANEIKQAVERYRSGTVNSVGHSELGTREIGAVIRGLLERPSNSASTSSEDSLDGTGG